MAICKKGGVETVDTPVTDATLAQKISAMFQNDGQRFETDIGTQLDVVCDKYVGGKLTYRDGHGTDTYRWDFEDGSSIVVMGACWDIGMSQDCFCGAEEGHQGTTCKLSPDYEEV